jgi:hypothetical protein
MKHVKQSNMSKVQAVQAHGWDFDRYAYVFCFLCVLVLAVVLISMYATGSFTPAAPAPLPIPVVAAPGNTSDPSLAKLIDKLDKAKPVPDYTWAYVIFAAGLALFLLGGFFLSRKMSKKTSETLKDVSDASRQVDKTAQDVSNLVNTIGMPSVLERAATQATKVTRQVTETAAGVYTYFRGWFRTPTEDGDRKVEGAR